MKISILDHQVSVSDQIGPDDVAAVLDGGVEIVVCNRPDGEAAGQPDFDAIAKLCREAGVDVHHIPFSGDAVEDHHIDAFLDLLQTGKRVHAYCRSGARSSKLWARTRRRQGESPEDLTARAGQAGFDVSQHV